MAAAWKCLLAAVALAAAACSPGGQAPESPQETAVRDETGPDAPASPATAPSRRPPWLVAVTTDHRLVVLDADSGETVRVLAEGDDPDDFGGAGEEPVAAGAFLDSVAVDQLGGVVYYSVCCEPAPGNLYRVPLAGGEPRHVGVGYDPAVSPDGASVAVVEMQWLSVATPDGETTTRFEPAAEMPMQISRPAWSPDGRTLAFEAMVDNHGEPEVHLLAADARSMEDARRVPADAAKAPWRSPVFDASGALWVLEQSAGPDAQETARLRVEPTTGEVLERRELSGKVTRQTYDRGGAHLLLVLAGGDLVWESGGTFRRLPGSFVSAAW